MFDSLKAFRDSVRALLTERGMEARELAKKAGMADSQLSLYLNGKKKISLPLVDRIAKALEVSPADLIASGSGAIKEAPNGGLSIRQVEEIEALRRSAIDKDIEIGRLKMRLDGLADFESMTARERSVASLIRGLQEFELGSTETRLKALATRKSEIFKKRAIRKS